MRDTDRLKRLERQELQFRFVSIRHRMSLFTDRTIYG